MLSTPSPSGYSPGQIHILVTSLMHSLPPFHLGSDCIMLLARSQIQQAENFYLCRGKRFPTVGMKQVKGEGRKSWREKRQEEYSWGI